MHVLGQAWNAKFVTICIDPTLGNSSGNDAEKQNNYNKETKNKNDNKGANKKGHTRYKKNNNNNNINAQPYKPKGKNSKGINGANVEANAERTLNGVIEYLLNRTVSLHLDFMCSHVDYLAKGYKLHILFGLVPLRHASWKL